MKLHFAPPLCTCAVFAALFALAAPARAALFVHEPFDYVPGTGVLAGKTGGTGWSGSWANAGVAVDVVAAGLSYADGGGRTLVTSGGMARANGTVAPGSSAAALRSINAAGYTGGTLYLSFLGQKETASSRAVSVAFFNPAPGTGEAVEPVSVGHGTDTPPGGFGGEFRWGHFTGGNGSNGQAGDTTNSHYSATPITEASLLVLKVEVNAMPDGKERLTLYVNPPLDAEPAVPSAVRIDTRELGNSMVDFGQIRLFAGGLNGAFGSGILLVDELRVGSSYADVTPHVTGGRVWDGGDPAATGNWTAGGNWNNPPSGPPVTNDVLSFPAGVTNAATVFDLTNGIDLSRLNFAAGYTVGNGGVNRGFDLRNGLTVDGEGAAGAAVSIGTNVTTLQAQTFQMAGPADSLTLSGAVTLTAGAVSLPGAGSLVLSSAVTGGSLQQSGPGRLVVNGGAGTTAVAVSAGTLGGTGSVGGVTVTGTGVIAPGGVSGDVTDDLGMTSLAIQSNAAVLQLDLEGPGAGTTYDQIDVSGAVTLQGTLAVTAGLNFSPAVNTVFTVVNKTGTGAVSGTFSGLAQNAVFTDFSGRLSLRISYTGSTGNDVTLTVTAVTPASPLRTWTGLGADANWTNPANWTGNIVPASGDILLFPPGAQRLSNTNNFPAGTSFDMLVIRAAGYTLSGNQVTLGSAIEANYTGESIVALDLRAGSPVDYTVKHGTLRHTGANNLSGNGVIFQIGEGDTTARWHAEGVVSGAEILTCRGPGQLVFHADNTFIDDMDADGGTLVALHPGAFGPGGTTTARNGGTVRFSVAGTPAESFILGTGGSLLDAGGATLTGPVQLLDAAGNFISGNGATLSGIVSGAGKLRTNGAITLAGTAANTFTGGTLVEESVLTLGKNTGITALASAVEINGNSARILLDDFEQIANTVTMTVKGGAVFDALGFDETVGGLVLDGSTVTAGGGLLSLGGNLQTMASAVTSVITGELRIIGTGLAWVVPDGAAATDLLVYEISGAGASVFRGGAGRVRLTGACSLTTLTLSAGTTVMDAVGNSAIVLNGGTLTGSGTTGAVTTTSAVAHQVQPGTGTGRLTSSSIALNAQTTLNCELLNSTPATGHDQWRTSGSVNLNGATLQFTTLPGLSVPPGSVFLLVDKTGAGAITGTFAGLAQGAAVSVGGVNFTLSYTGGTGNDVTLTSQTLPPTIESFTATPGTAAPGAPVNFAWQTTGAATLSISPLIGNVLPVSNASGDGSVAFNGTNGTTTFTLTAANPAGTVTATVTVTQTGVPLIQSFTTTPATGPPGTAPVLGWNVLGATAISINQSVGSVTAQTQTDGSGTVTAPAVTRPTTYILTATNASGQSTRNVTFDMSVAPTIQSFTVTPQSAAAGAPVTFAWQTTGAATVQLESTQGNVDLTPQTNAQGAGSLATPAPAQTTTFTLRVTNSAGQATQVRTLTIVPPPVITSFTTTDLNVLTGATVDLNWTTQNATTASISPRPGSVPVSGTVCDIISSTTTYTLTVTNVAGSATTTLTVTVPVALAVSAARWTVQVASSNGTLSNLAGADAVLAGTNVNATRSGTLTNEPDINYFESSGSFGEGVFTGSRQPPFNATNHYALKGTATLRVFVAGTYEFGINNDDGGRLRIGGQDVIVQDALQAPTTSTGEATLTAGDHSIEYVYFDASGGSGGEVFWFPAAGAPAQLLNFAPEPPAITMGDVAISEFMASNDRTLIDSFGDSPDWIEIFNGTSAPQQLSGLFLSDNSSNPGKWPFPARVLQPGEHLIVFASGRNTVTTGGELHTNFSLASGGEHLGLYRQIAGGTFVRISGFAGNFATQFEDVSFGFYDTEQYPGFFLDATPGGTNGVGFDGFAPEVAFSVPRGFYTTPQSVALNLVPGTGTAPANTFEIRFTTDGSIPGAANGTVYTGTPVTISDTRPLRAAAVRKHFATTEITTATYVFVNDVITQTASTATSRGFPAGPVNGQVYAYGMNAGVVAANSQGVKDALNAIPTFSLVIDQLHFSHPQTGIYSNASDRGVEVPCSLEYLNETGTGAGAFQIDCGTRIRGGFSRQDGNPRHAFRFLFKKEYDGALNFDLFKPQGAVNDPGAGRFEKLDLRTAQNHSWSFQQPDTMTFLREEFGRDTQRDTGSAYSRCRFAHLYINGIYWGLFNTDERPDEDFGATYFGGSEDSYDVVKSSGFENNFRTEATNGSLLTNPEGSTAAWKRLWDKVRAMRTGPTAQNDATFFEIQGLAPDGRTPLAGVLPLLDVDNLVDYMLTVGYCGSRDAPIGFSGASNNWFGIRSPETAVGFRFFVHDFEHSMGSGRNTATTDDRIKPLSGAAGSNVDITDFNRSNPHFLHEDLAFGSPEYRVRFGDRAHRLLFNGGALTDSAALARLNTRIPTVRTVLPAEQARWGNTTTETVATWELERLFLERYVTFGSTDGVNALSGPGRRARVLEHCRIYANPTGVAKPLYPPIEAPEAAPPGGVVTAGTNVVFTIPGTNTPPGTIHVTLDGNDPRLAGGGINPSAQPLNSGGGVAVNSSLTLKARVFDGTNWSALVETRFVTGTAASAADFVISEIHYNPAPSTAAEIAAGFPDSHAFEFLEVFNAGSAQIDLSGVRFGNGVVFEFPAGTLMAAGQRLVIVPNEAAFALRYPAAPAGVVAGVYAGDLANSGENLTLISFNGAVIKNFSFDDDAAAGWPITPDGGGPSLVLNTPETNPNPALAANWRAHIAAGGNPGGADATGFFHWSVLRGIPNDPWLDGDLDGLPALVEYSMAANPKGFDPVRQHIASSLEYFNVGGVLGLYRTFVHTHKTDAEGIVLNVQSSADLTTWSDGSDWLLKERTDHRNGTETWLWRTTHPVSPEESNRFFRLLVSLAP